MENIKYILFYALLIGVIVTGAMQYHWLVMFLAAFILTISFILVKGKDWKQLMGRTDLNGVVVFIGTFISQAVLSGILYGIGRLIGYFIH
ncbi:MAG: hypothetical protein KGV56_04040 [Gammaproteobacteria bacterium]|nr:hypothetical protein [Gammaproteobacteria bacterium]